MITDARRHKMTSGEVEGRVIRLKGGICSQVHAELKSDGYREFRPGSVQDSDIDRA
jgi:hypothetical protein